MPSTSCAHRLEDSEQEFQFPVCSPPNAHVFKIGTLVFQVAALAKRQQDSPLLRFCYGFNKAFGFLVFNIIKDFFPEINCQQANSFYFFHVY
jgi:hypothetical protein